MKQRIVTYCLSSFLLFSGCFSAQEKEKDHLIQHVVETTQVNHFSPRQIDDTLSEQLFEYYLNQLDPERMILSSEDLQALHSFKYSLDNTLLESSPLFIRKVTNIYDERVNRISKHVDSLMRYPFNLESKETIHMLADKPSRPLNEEEVFQHWRRQIHLLFNEALYYQTQLAKSNQTKKEQIEAATSSVKRQMRNKLNGLKDQSFEQNLALFLKSYLALNDLQSSYLSTEEKEAWNQSFQRSYGGIGVRLENRNGLTVITQLREGGAAIKSRLIQKGDVILAVKKTQNDLTISEQMGFQEILNSLRGAEGTKVDIIISRNGKKQNVVLVRERLQMELASAFIINEGSKDRVGYLKLPRFYTGSNSSSEDIQHLLVQLNDKSIESLVLDLRNNQGGSAREAIQIIGYFLNGGPVMRASYRDRDDRIFNDPDSTSLYKGKLIVLVNSNSSSASELTAGTLQDYKRAIVVGNTTYGKGTIQRFLPLGSDSIPNLGEVKLTIGQFYTASGRSAQYYGIQPDVILPGEVNHKQSGSRKNPLAYPLSDTTPNLYQLHQNNAYDFNIDLVQSASHARTEKQSVFSKQSDFNGRNEENIPLNWEYYLEYRAEKSKAASLEMQHEVFLSVEPLSQKKEAVQSLKIANDPSILESYRILESLN